MNSRERVLSSLARTGYDRIPVKHEAEPEIPAMLLEHFGLANYEQLLRVIGDDFRYVRPEYIGPELRNLAVARESYRIFEGRLPSDEEYYAGMLRHDGVVR